jgi:hypothetical protein
MPKRPDRGRTTGDTGERIARKRKPIPVHPDDRSRPGVCTCPKWPEPHWREHGCPDPLTDLAEKAKRATPGPWHRGAAEVYAAQESGDPYDILLPGSSAPRDLDYIAACSPERILALVERVRELERTDA